MLPPIEQRIAAELAVDAARVLAAVQLLDTGASVPFIARYRKEVTGNLDDTQLRELEARLSYLRELEERRSVIFSSIDEQGKLTPELRESLESAATKQRLEDLYLPYKPKRRSKAQIAREAGLAPLAEALRQNPLLLPEEVALPYVDEDKQLADVKAVLDGARQIVMEELAEDAGLLEKLRRCLKEEAILVARVVEGKEAEGAKYRDWFEYQEALQSIPSHRVLALLRGRNEDVLRLSIKTAAELRDPPQASPCIALITQHAGFADQGRPADRWLLETARWAWLVKLSLHFDSELMTALRESAEQEAIRVFARNLHDLLLAAPAGQKTVIGLDPGIRTGVKVAVVNDTGKVLETATLYPHEPRRDWDGSIEVLRRLAQKHQAQLIAIGNGTASRETDNLAADLIKRHKELKLSKVIVSEAGASVYSASALAAQEFPEMDVSLRGAVSIARRLQDPLAELVKIDPKSIGVGQYQHDVNQSMLAKSLEAVVEDCVNSVGVDVNTASVPLLARVAGLNQRLAENIVGYRDSNGAFTSRQGLKKIPRLGDRTFEQAAGFLRINNSSAAQENPLDASAVHPEAYPVVERILADIGRRINEVIGNRSLIHTLDAEKYTDEKFGLPTVRDILSELEKPGRDPRPEFKTALFRDGIETLKDLKPGMQLEGVVTNITNFGAFVDVGVHQDGLVHISAMADHFVKDPHQLVKNGDVVTVRVVEVDIERKRIALTMRKGEAALAVQAAAPGKTSRQPGKPRQQNEETVAVGSGAMAQAFARLKR